jgi:hypothetical protein
LTTRPPAANGATPRSKMTFRLQEPGDCKSRDSNAANILKQKKTNGHKLTSYNSFNNFIDMED